MRKQSNSYLMDSISKGLPNVLFGNTEEVFALVLFAAKNLRKHGEVAIETLYRHGKNSTVLVTVN